jgi:T5SS/PEP-CTERM-associated repeat protein
MGDNCTVGRIGCGVCALSAALSEDFRARTKHFPRNRERREPMKLRLHSRTRLACLITALIGLPASTTLATITSSGDVSPANPATWTTSTFAYIGNTSIGSVGVNADSALNSEFAYLGFSVGASGTATVDGAGSTWTSAYDFEVGDSGNGTLNITNGGTVNSQAIFVAELSGSTGLVSISGPGSKLAGNPAVYVGTLGNGTLDITAGGSISPASFVSVGVQAGSTGLLTVSGAGSTLAGAATTDVGSYGSGTLNIASAATVSSGSVELGLYSGSSGVASVDGPGSTWTINNNYGSEFDVGSAGRGTLNITNGGTVTVSANTAVASQPGATGVIHLSNGTLNTGGLLAGLSELTGTGTINAGGLVSDVNLVFDATHGPQQTFVFNSLPGQNVTLNLNPTGGALGAGYLGSGSLRIAGGVGMSSNAGYLGYMPGSTGVATVDGAGSTWMVNAGPLYVGLWGHGTLNITNGGVVTGSQATYLGANPGATGVINFNNGTLTTRQLWAPVSGLTGVGTINTTGLVSDLNLVFDATHGLKQTLVLNGLPGQNITLNLDISDPHQSGPLGAGYAGSGSLRIAGGAAVSVQTACLGYLPGSAGAGTVDGAGSKWTIWGPDCDVGYGGNGTLNITNGGAVSSQGFGYIGDSPGSAGTVTVSGIGSQWTAADGYVVVGSSGNGTLNINHGGTVSSSNVYLAGSSFGSVPGATGSATVDGAGSALTIGGTFTIGYSGDGTLSITNGGTVSNGAASIGGSLAGSASAVTVNGTGSTWNTQSLFVGAVGNAALHVSHGGTVSAGGSGSAIGGSGGSTSTVTVDGAGSAWTNSGDLLVGNAGAAVLSITNGGTVTSSGAFISGNYPAVANTVTVDGAGSNWTDNGVLNILEGALVIAKGGVVSATSASIEMGGTLVAIDVGGGSKLTVGSGAFNNNGRTLRIVADGADAAGVYTPIVAGTWSDWGADQALGGVWNTTNHTFTVSNAKTGTAGQGTSIDLSNTQRLVITAPTSGASVGASFQPTVTSSTLTFTATTMTDQNLAALDSLLNSGASVLAGWQFAAGSAYTPGNPAYLSIQVGSGYSLGSLDIWHFDGTHWTQYTPSDLTYDGGYANFTVTGFSGYAVVDAVPEPATLMLFALGGGIVLLRRRRPRRAA